MIFTYPPLLTGEGWGEVVIKTSPQINNLFSSIFA